MGIVKAVLLDDFVVLELAYFTFRSIKSVNERMFA
jgi:hypothetical protein